MLFRCGRSQHKWQSHKGKLPCRDHLGQFPPQSAIDPSLRHITLNDRTCTRGTTHSVIVRVSPTPQQATVHPSYASPADRAGQLHSP